MSASPEKREHLYKILVIGELGTGKTSFIKRYVHQFFSQNYRATIGVDFALKVLNWDANTIIRLQLWDIAGEYTPHTRTHHALVWLRIDSCHTVRLTCFFSFLCTLAASVWDGILFRSRTLREHDTCVLQRSRWRVHRVRCDT